MSAQTGLAALFNNWLPTSLSSFSHAKRHRGKLLLPCFSGVYALMIETSAGATPMYIGMSSDIQRRVRQHPPGFTAVWFFKCDESSARTIERTLIAKYCPPGNIQSNPSYTPRRPADRTVDAVRSPQAPINQVNS